MPVPMIGPILRRTSRTGRQSPRWRYSDQAIPERGLPCRSKAALSRVSCNTGEKSVILTGALGPAVNEAIDIVSEPNSRSKETQHLLGGLDF
jgi:hypothetical protein